MRKKLLCTSYLLFVFFCGFAQQNKVVDLKVQGNKKTRASFIKKIAKVKAGSCLLPSI